MADAPSDFCEALPVYQSLCMTQLMSLASRLEMELLRPIYTKLGLCFILQKREAQLASIL